MEVYVDDMISKSVAEAHMFDLGKIFERLRKYDFKLYSSNCVFDATFVKLLHVIVSQRRIEIDPCKIKAIIEMWAQKKKNKVKDFLGRLNYISRFIAQLTTTCKPLYNILRKNTSLVWNEDCPRAFEKIKVYLLNPPCSGTTSARTYPLNVLSHQ